MLQSRSMKYLIGFFYLAENYISMKIRLLALLIIIPFLSYSQENKEWFNKRFDLKENSPLDGVTPQNIGPTVFSGRVADLDVNPNKPSEFYVAYASGGLWYTNNNGTSFSPIFDHEAVMTIGDIAVDWKNNVIYVGTGEVNSSRSSYAGYGVYKSEDQGKSWTHCGLENTEHIGRICLFPDEPNKVAVAALGKLYSTNNERGVYISNDGGTSWEHTLFVDSITGAVDLKVDPSDDNVIYACMWHRIRKAWNFVESGKGSGIYKSVDGGVSWNKVSLSTSGFPDGDGTGRIGIDISADGKYVYAILDNYNRRPVTPKTESDELEKDYFKTMDKSAFAKIKDEDLKLFLKSNGFPKKYSASKVKKMVANEKIKPAALAEYLEDANRLLFDTPVIAAEVYLSEDGGKNWNKTHDDYINSVFNSYGYYFGQIRVSPQDPNKIYIMGVPIFVSEDGGKNFKNINGDNVHVDHHALWCNPSLDGHLINGNDGGVNISYDDGQNWIKCNSPTVGQFYYINVDYAKPYNVYGGLQDNGVWVGSNNYQGGTRWHSTGQYPYREIMGGDGMQIQIDNRDNATVYTGFQFGNYFRMNTKTEDRQYITPKHELGDRPYRWNWQSPIHLSSHNQDILYMGANKLLRSFDQGDNFEEISEDLTRGGKKGDVPFGTLTSVNESKLKFGLIYTGSDDGAVFVTKDGGNNWEDISVGLPDGLWVSRIQASAFSESRVYLSLNNYRNDDRKAYVYKSEDYGKTWEDLSQGLPIEAVNVIKEDPSDEDIIVVGTDHGSYISFDRGTNFIRLNGDMPMTPVHDMVFQEVADHLLIGTHGRSIYKYDMSAIRFFKSNSTEDFAVQDISKIRYNGRWGEKYRFNTETYEPGMDLFVYCKGESKLTMEVLTEDKKQLTKKEYTLDSGVNKVNYDLSIDESQKGTLKKALELKKDPKAKSNGKYYLSSGKYFLRFKSGKTVVDKSFEIE